jgi:hypothetical protein
MRQLFLTVTVPRMECALPVWYRPVSPNEDARRAGIDREGPREGPAARYEARHGRTANDSHGRAGLAREPPPRTYPTEPVGAQRGRAPRLPPTKESNHIAIWWAAIMSHVAMLWGSGHPIAVHP